MSPNFLGVQAPRGQEAWQGLGEGRWRVGEDFSLSGVCVGTWAVSQPLLDLLTDKPWGFWWDMSLGEPSWRRRLVPLRDSGALSCLILTSPGTEISIPHLPLRVRLLCPWPPATGDRRQNPDHPGGREKAEVGQALARAKNGGGSGP